MANGIGSLSLSQSRYDYSPNTGGKCFDQISLVASKESTLFLLIGAATAGSNYFVSQAYRLGEASLVAPLEYVALPMGVMFGVVIFGDWPGLSTWIGITLIVGAGLFVVWRETLVARSKKHQPPRPQ